MGRVGILSKLIVQRLDGSFFFRTGKQDLGFMTLFAKERPIYYSVRHKNGYQKQVRWIMLPITLDQRR